MTKHIIRSKQHLHIAEKRGHEKNPQRADDHKKAKKCGEAWLGGEDRVSKRKSVPNHLLGFLLFVRRRGLLRGSSLRHRCRVSKHVIGFHGTVKNADVSRSVLRYLLIIMRNHDQQLISRHLSEERDDLL